MWRNWCLQQTGTRKVMRKTVASKTRRKNIKTYIAYAGSQSDFRQTELSETRIIIMSYYHTNGYWFGVRYLEQCISKCSTVILYYNNILILCVTSRTLFWCWDIKQILQLIRFKVFDNLTTKLCLARFKDFSALMYSLDRLLLPVRRR